jgi:DNA-directed RNA polymerase subunit RPC12/RpoP
MDFQLLRSFDNYINASITLARLDEEGITCYLKDEYTVTIDPLLSNAVGGIKLMVMPGDFEQARMLLDGYDKDYRSAIKCPECESHDVEHIVKPGSKSWKNTLLSWFFSSHAEERVYHCYECGFEFNNLPEEPLTIAGA